MRTALPNGCTPLGSEASAASQEESQSLTCDFSACEEHSPGSPDNDCCGWDDQTFCPQGYIKSKVPTSQPGVRWINAPAGFPTDWGCPNTAPYNGNTCCHSASLVGSATYTPVSGRGCSSYVHMDDPYTHGVTGGSTTLEQCAAAVLAYNGQDGCVANYFFFESGGYCNCPRDATCSETPNSNAGGPGQLYHFTGVPSPPASQDCPASHPFQCASESDVNNIEVRKYFNGPCCDKNSDCICDAYCGEGCDDGAHALPHEPVPVGEPDASCKVSAGTVGDLLWAVSWGGLHAVSYTHLTLPTKLEV